jgi:hypothetical protein
VFGIDGFRLPAGAIHPDLSESINLSAPEYQDKDCWNWRKNSWSHDRAAYSLTLWRMNSLRIKSGSGPFEPSFSENWVVDD